MSEDLAIQQVADRTGLSIHTLRYYERMGLMAPIKRALNNHRRYTSHDLEWIELVQCLRATAMPIADVQRFAAMVQQGEATIPQRRKLLEEHRRALYAQLQQIEHTLMLLDAKIEHYSARGDELESHPEQNQD